MKMTILSAIFIFALTSCGTTRIGDDVIQAVGEDAALVFYDAGNPNSGQGAMFVQLDRNQSKSFRELNKTARFGIGSGAAETIADSAFKNDAAKTASEQATRQIEAQSAADITIREIESAEKITELNLLEDLSP